MIPYLDNGFLSMGELLSHAPPYSFIWGGRGIGKTYGALEYIRLDKPQKFVILRRTQKQVDILRKPLFNPFKALDSNRGCTTTVVKDGDGAVFYDGEEKEGKIQPVGPPLGYMFALSAIHNVRGFDLSDVEILLFDEFIPEAHERPITDEFTAFLNAVETIARNRELQGKKPLQVVCLSNSNTITNPYFMGLGVMRRVYEMSISKQEEWRDDERGLLLVNVTHSPISDAKRKTSLYKLAGDSTFADGALDNSFTEESIAEHRPIPLRECRPVVKAGEICIYEHRYSNLFYVTDHASGSPETYTSDPASIKQFRRAWAKMIGFYYQGLVVFDTALSESIFRLYLKV